jgi:sensor histidine kinase YesM
VALSRGTPDTSWAWWRFSAFLPWAVLALAGALGGALFIAANPDSGSWVRAFSFSFGWLAWWLATPFIVRLSQEAPIRTGSWRSSLVRHVPVAVALAMVPSIINVVFGEIAGVPFSSRGWFASAYLMLFWRYPLDLMTYAAVAVLASQYHLQSIAREQELSTSRLTAELADARLLAITRQMHPHFLFNSLNGIAMLVREELYDDALKMLLAYGELLREVLDTEVSLVPIEREFAFIDRYVGIEQMRFPDTFVFEATIARSADGALVPSLILQPIIENSIRHGFADANANAGAKLTVSATRIAERLVMEIADNGTGLPAEFELGVGLSSVEARLAHQYGADQSMLTEPLLSRGTLVRIDIPYRTAADEVGSAR